MGIPFGEVQTKLSGLNHERVETLANKTNCKRQLCFMHVDYRTDERLSNEAHRILWL